ncbi:uncharacterized protein Z519_06699 [Cladophialophora bantiana CBS 173.52]|uniref:Uncharacterized protein n=1 Tax=Cladophialophora bantiana (strain ATCC 10958 / CBS 173.52 / CDC B-1940 / NIH 8579) TaxID=1442370 RepID=A0A0D2HPS4_CLAB1|nr:uncharacterized protein Z519_06699 [Cladophialophora bantiana CBS 173.52]KIW92850.1 hypothetical protein Z519_06699 [Cladophialophora bantiana CBS 173.52]
MTSRPLFTSGRMCLSIVALATSVGCYMADWNETHVKNPRWPPHARFHNGQTMSMGLCLGVLTAYFAWRPVLDRYNADDGRTATKSGSGGTRIAETARSGRGKGHIGGIGEKESVTISAVLGTLYWITGLSGILYPGTKWVDPEFGEGAPQVPLFVGLAVLAWCGWGLEMRRLGQV